jgi:hypothetical protein
MTKEFRAWVNLRKRCDDSKYQHFRLYGGRGITYCKEWEVFDSFFKDMGVAPIGTSLDRIDSNGNYCKSNCRWATPFTQGNNRRDNIILEYNGKKQTISNFSKEFGISRNVVRRRLQKGWSTEKALTTPVEKRGITIEFNGEIKTRRQWERDLKFPTGTLYQRIVVYGWSIERAITTPVESWDRFIEYNGLKLNCLDWEKKLGLKKGTLNYRLNERNWSIKDALETPNSSSKDIIEYNGLMLSKFDWSRKMGLPKYIIGNRLRDGWSIERAITTPLSHKTAI